MANETARTIFWWWGSFLAWDGVLPLAVSAVPFATRRLFPKGDVAEVAAAVLVPIVAALLRVTIGAEQIRRICDNVLPWGRQLAMAAAIVLLLVFEIVVGMLTFADDEPASAWMAPLGFYLGYLTTIVWALRPRSESSPASAGQVCE